MGLSKHAKILHKLLRWTGPHAGAWLCDVAELNPSLGLKRRHVYPALDELAENRLVKIKVESLRDPKHPKRLIKGRALKDLPYLKIEHLEETPISIKNLEAQILRLLLSCRSIEDNEFAEGWKHKYYSWDADQKIFQLTHHFIEINQCFYLLNLVNAIKGLRTVRTSDRKELLRYYHLAFKLMKKDQDYKIVWPTMRQRLLPGDIKPLTMDEQTFFSALRMPFDPCVCTHTLRDHDDGKKCQPRNEQGILCDCEQFRLKGITVEGLAPAAPV